MKLKSVLLRLLFALFVLPLLLLLGLILWFDADDFRTDLEDLVANNTPMTLSIGAPIEHSLSEPYLFTFRDLSLKFEDAPLLTLERFAIRIGHISPFRRDLGIAGISLDRPDLDLDPARLERLLQAFEANKVAEVAPSDEPSLLPIKHLTLSQVNMNGLSLRWEDLDKPIRLKELTLDVSDWEVIKQSQLKPRNWLLSAELTAEEVSWQGLMAQDLTLYAAMDNDYLVISELSLALFDGELGLSAKIRLDDGLATEIHQLRLSDLQLNNDELALIAGQPEAGSEPTQEAEPELADDSASDAGLIPDIEVPIEQLLIDALNIENLSLAGQSLLPDLQLQRASLSLGGFQIIDQHRLAPANWRGKLAASLTKLNWQAHEIDNIKLDAVVEQGVLTLSELSAQALQGDLLLTATTALADDLATEITLLQLRGMQIEDSLWRDPEAQTDAEPDAQSSDDNQPEQVPQEVAEEAQQAPLRLPIKSLRLEQLALLDMGVRLTEPAFSGKVDKLAFKGVELIRDYQLLAVAGYLAQPFTLTSQLTDIRFQQQQVESVDLDLNGGERLMLNHLTAKHAKGQGKVTGELDPGDAALPFSLNAKLEQLDLSLLDMLDLGYPLRGRIDMDADLSGEAVSTEALIASLTGPVHLRSGAFKLLNVDLDTTVNSFLDSQELTLKDVGAFALLGPIGLALTKSAAVGGAAMGALAGGETRFAASDIKVSFDRGVLSFDETAAATQQHRIAVFGGLDLPQSQFNEMFLTLLDEKACVRFARAINGPFSQPDMQVVSAVTGTVTGLFSGVFAGTEKYFGDGCEAVYAGPVKAPKQYSFEDYEDRVEEAQEQQRLEQEKKLQEQKPREAEQEQAEPQQTDAAEGGAE